jgi:hypothetical protein
MLRELDEVKLAVLANRIGINENIKRIGSSKSTFTKFLDIGLDLVKGVDLLKPLVPAIEAFRATV